MAVPDVWANLQGTFYGSMFFANGGPLLKSQVGGLNVRNAGDTADLGLTASVVNVSGDSLVLNSDSLGTEADWKITLARPVAGMTANLTLTFPSTAGTAGQVLGTDGAGNLSWMSAASTATSLKSDTTTVNYNSSSPVVMFDLPANAVVEMVVVYVDTAFNATGPASLTVGKTGTTSKYLGTGDVDLTVARTYHLPPGLASTGSLESLIATFSAGTGGSTGVARVEVWYANPA